MNEKGSLSPVELVARWDGAVCIGTLANWRSKGAGPQYKKFLGRVRYPAQPLAAWEKKNGFDVVVKKGKK